MLKRLNTTEGMSQTLMFRPFVAVIYCPLNRQQKKHWFWSCSTCDPSLLQQPIPTQRPAHRHGSQPPLRRRKHLPDSSRVVQRSVYLMFNSVGAFVPHWPLYLQRQSQCRIKKKFPPFSPPRCRICRKDKIPLTSSPRWASPCLLPAASTPQWLVFRRLSPACCLPPLVFVDNTSLLWLLLLHVFMSSTPYSASSLAFK